MAALEPQYMTILKKVLAARFENLNVQTTR